MIMQDLRLQEYIPSCFSSHQIQATKPDRKAFDAVLDRMNVQAENVLFLDDLQASIDSAKELGMQAVKVTGTTGGVKTARSLKLIQE
jgi:HAD superfamily hydrolase (TIGR01509 family)